VLNLSDLLIGETSGTIANFVSVTDAGGNTTLSIDTTGDVSGTDFEIVLNGVTGVTLTDLLNDSNLIIDT